MHSASVLRKVSQVVDSIRDNSSSVWKREAGTKRRERKKKSKTYLNLVTTRGNLLSRQHWVNQQGHFWLRLCGWPEVGSWGEGLPFVSVPSLHGFEEACLWATQQTYLQFDLLMNSVWYLETNELTLSPWIGKVSHQKFSCVKFLCFKIFMCKFFLKKLCSWGRLQKFHSRSIT